MSSRFAVSLKGGTCWGRIPYFLHGGKEKLESEGRAYLIDYLAVLPSLRDRGYGSACLRALQDVFGENLVMVESEEPSFAVREAERQVRRRRISFYEKNGFFDSRNICRLFGVEYRILGKSDCVEEEHRQMRCREELDSIYRTVIPKIAYGSQVKWL